MNDRALKIKDYYDRGLWRAEWVQNAVDKGVISQEEADEILGSVAE